MLKKIQNVDSVEDIYGIAYSIAGIIKASGIKSLEEFGVLNNIQKTLEENTNHSKV